MLISKAKKMIWLWLYYVLLDIVYVKWLSPNYLYKGFTASTDIVCSVISILAMLIASYVIPNLIESKGASNMIIALIIVLYYFPQCVLFSECLHNYGYFMFVSLYMMLMCILNKYIKFNSKPKSIKTRVDLFVILIVILGIMMILISGVYSGFRISFNMDKYYEYRFAVREMPLPTIFVYILNWARSLLPIGLSYGIIKKKRFFVIFTMVAQVLCFSFDGKKSALFLFFLAMGISLFYNDVYKKYIPFGMALLCIATLFEESIRSGASFLGKNIIRRMMFVPAYLGWAFYDFFSVNQFDYLRSSIFRWFGSVSPYSEGIPRIIGRLYYATSSSGAVNANTGLCGDAFSNFGWLSLLFYPLANILIFKFLEKYMNGHDYRLQMVVCISVAYTFLSGSLFSVLLTNGVLLMILLFIIIPKEYDVDSMAKSIELKME